MYSEPHNRPCITCKKHFLAETEWSDEENDFVSSPICPDCDAKIHRMVDKKLEDRGHKSPDRTPEWYDNSVDFRETLGRDDDV